jgi:L-fuculose-phosphate aldolase
VITRRGSALGHLVEQDLVETGLFRDDPSTPLASTELPVHRAIYHRTSASAIIHAHLPDATALSLTTCEIIPVVGNRQDQIGRVPVIGYQQEVGPGEFADEIARSLVEHRVVMVYGHGSFARGQQLGEALDCTIELEACSRILRLSNSTPHSR